MTGLPSSWAIVPIVDVLEPNENGKPFQQGWSPQCASHPAAEDSWGVLKTTAIQPGQFWDHQNKELPSALSPRPKIEVRPGDLLMTCAGPRARCGVVCLVEHTRPRLMMSGKMYRFRPNKEALLPRYLSYFIQSRAAQVAIDAMKTGISDSGLNLTHDRFATLAIPIAPLPEQHLIVAKIEELMSELDKGVEYLEAAKRQCEIYREIILERAFSRMKESRPLPELLAQPMCNGYSGSPVQRVTPRKVLSLSATTSGVFLHEHFKYLDEPGLDSRDIWCEPGDILVQRGNTAEYVGVPAIYTGGSREFIFPDLMIRLRAERSLITPAYLYYALSTPSIRNELRSKAKGSAGTMPKISQKILSEIKIPYCDPDAQLRITEHIEEVSSRLTAMEHIIAEQLPRTMALRYSILERAFEGRLAPQNSADEPVMSLLKRIRSKQENNVIKKMQGNQKKKEVA